MTTPPSTTTTTAQPLDGSSLVEDYKRAKKRLLLLDYDGSLVDFVDNPADAKPDAALTALITKLAAHPNNTVAIVSGRDKDTLGNWWGTTPHVSLIAEHGAWRFQDIGGWNMCRDDLPAVTAQWKSTAMPILDAYCQSTPGSFVEVKNFSLVWHCRQSPAALAPQRMRDLQTALQEALHGQPVGIHQGAMIVELKNHGVNKGAAVQTLLQDGGYDFVYIAGDDYTDEDMFVQANDKAFTVKVGSDPTSGRFRVRHPTEHKQWLQQLADAV